MFELRNMATAYTATGMLIFAIIITVISGKSYLEMRTPSEGIDQVVPHEGFIKKRLSDYFEDLKETAADTDIYIQEAEEPGGTVLVLGGTHANEPAGVIAAVVMLERSALKQGRLIIVPYANMMGRSHTFPQDAHPQTFGFSTTSGQKRIFRYGSRTTN
ncbi:MAG: succinylglutamate desuccinylase, partial [Gammaproteobacteria bacterium]|nr:succinylglutamate desuccinylase [Gammaproteobacteria bacterium]